MTRRRSPVSDKDYIPIAGNKKRSFFYNYLQPGVFITLAGAAANILRAFFSFCCAIELL